MLTKMDSITNTLTDNFDVIHLSEMDKVKLMNRIDTKYWFPLSNLPNLLKLVQDDYFILEINKKEISSYKSTYFDTDKYAMYTAHHNGKLNRFKVRKRRYLDTEVNFLEVKFKNNKGRTIKKRIKIENDNMVLTENEKDFVEAFTPFKSIDLKPVLTNEFKRITLVNKNFKERCTIDFNISFKYENNVSDLPDFTIVEIKSDGKNTNSSLSKVLKEKRIKSSGFSKYCIGMAYINKNIKKNSFKNKLLKINKFAI